MPPTNKIIRLALLSISVVALTFAASCSKSGGSGLHIKSSATGEKDAAAKSSYAYAVTKSFTDVSGKITTAAAYYVYAANYDLDAGNFAMTLDKPLTSEDQVRVVFSLIGEEGTNEKATLKAGTYSAKADKYLKVETVGIVSRRGSSDTKTWLDRSTLSGQVTVTSATADEIAGDIDVTAGDNSIKGSFKAKVLKRK